MDATTTISSSSESTNNSSSASAAASFASRPFTVTVSEQGWRNRSSLPRDSRGRGRDEADDPSAE